MFSPVALIYSGEMQLMIPATQLLQFGYIFGSLLGESDSKRYVGQFWYSVVQFYTILYVSARELQQLRKSHQTQPMVHVQIVLRLYKFSSTVPFSTFLVDVEPNPARQKKKEKRKKKKKKRKKEKKKKEKKKNMIRLGESLNGWRQRRVDELRQLAVSFRDESERIARKADSSIRAIVENFNIPLSEHL